MRGGNTKGQLGINSTSSSNYSTFQSVPSITNIKQLAGGQRYTLGLKTDGTLVSCGQNNYGQLGINSTTTSNYSSFQTVPSITGVKQIACGGHHSSGLMVDGTLIACGRNDFGQLGINSTPTSRYSTFQTIPSITNIKQIACGYGHTLGLKTDGTLISTGYNHKGQLGINSTTTSAYSSFQTIPSITNIKQIACGYYHSFGIKTDGTLISCGYNSYGQLGINSTSSSNYSTFQSVPAITGVKQIAASFFHSLALKTDGTLISCGWNVYGELGLNTASSNYSSFQTVPSITGVKQIACGGVVHSLGLKTDGTLISCGYNSQGQLGINSTTSSYYSSFQSVPSITNIKRIAAGRDHSLLIMQII